MHRMHARTRFGAHLATIAGLVAAMAATGLPGGAGDAAAAITLSNGVAATQNFTIGTSSTATLPTDWKANYVSTSRTVGSYSSGNLYTATQYRAGNNMPSGASSLKGVYNYAAGDPASATDRAVGFLTSGTTNRSMNLMALYTNSSGIANPALVISYNVEKYRNGSGPAHWIQLYYSTDGESWTSAGAGFLTSFTADANDDGFSSAPGSTTAVSGTLVTTGVTSGGSLYLGWNCSTTSGDPVSDTTPGLGIDDVSVTAHIPWYRSRATGNWNSTSTWQVSLDGGGYWRDTTATPTSSDGAITIRDGHTVTVTAAVTVDEVTVESGGTLAASAAITNNGMTVNGTFQRNTSGSVSAAPTYGSGSKLVYAAAFTTGNEWGTGASVGVGVPQDVTIQAGSGNSVTLAGSRAVPDSLTFTSGRLATGTDTLTVGATGSISGAGAGQYVYGNLARVIPTGAQSPSFAIGDATNYTPVALAFGSVVTQGTVTATSVAVGGAPPTASDISATKYVDRKWTLTQSGGSLGGYSATFTFVSGDVKGGADTDSFIVAKNTGGTWTKPTVGTRTSTTTQATGLNGFSDFYLGETAGWTITASAGAHGSIDPSGAVTVAKGGSQEFTMAGATGYHLDSLYVDESPVTATSPYTFTNVTANHTIRATFVANPSVPAITALAAAQVKTGNSDSTTTVRISWPAVGSGLVVEIFRAGFGNYPEYDDGPTPGSVPAAPTSYPPSGRWAAVDSVAAPDSTYDDQAATRDFHYYVAVVTDQYGTHSAISNRTTGTLNYHLGDVIDPADSLLAGDDLVDGADISSLGARYGASVAYGDRYNYLDVGPTTDYSPNSLPLTDNVIDFEDLVVFGMNYECVSAPQNAVQRVAADRDELLLEAPDRVVAGDNVTVSLLLKSTGAVQGLATKLSWDPGVVEPVGYAAGDLAGSQGALVLSARPGTVDAAVLGTGAGFRGEGTVATVAFRALNGGDPKIHLASADARDQQNRKVSLTTSERALKSLPTVTQLSFATPNPFRQTVTLAFSLAQAGPVELAVYSVDGRRVRTLVREFHEPGEYRVTWDGRDEHGHPMSAGIYYAHLKAAQRGFARTLTYLR